MDEKERLEKLIYDNKQLSLQIQTLQDRLEDYQKRLVVLDRMTEEWAKSYDRLLKDFVAYRNRSER